MPGRSFVMMVSPVFTRVVNMFEACARRLLVSCCLVSALVSLDGCASVQVPAHQERLEVKSRFLLTFDDGPDGRRSSNLTVHILEDLARNSVQQNLKAIFFVQTRNPDGGGSEYGRTLLQREYAEGHIVALHSGTERGHVSHIWMSSRELDESLRDGVEDIKRITGQNPLLVRPPYWWFNPDTLAHYERLGLHMILSDVKAYDGVNWGMHIFRRANIEWQLTTIRERLALNRLPVVAGIVPIIVTFHDTNEFTAGHLEEYLRILVEEAWKAGLPMDDKPFYDDSTELMYAALQRAIPALRPEVNVRLPVMNN